ncbi:hypothetical protein QO001_006438 [Methylobacterium brachiatum]|jgi:hypothetical protein|uniref:PepSY domain-containing protein n=1 Tax=Methylobacterium brachiatum TaxID=269660 RepID=A0AAJ1TZ41_9HYPH|nr:MULTISPECIES: PepSY domain-containing protein [Methylobacterium]MCB4806456.1 PepSY domain-containing protein [Methylobacterium brachiatum]MDQ0547479.1 hypothetical protein [Methylobacterium brachiatum]WKV18914.1 PepSY domain-containing protein [Methylobacterium radiotolerans JCM 2831]
MSMWKLGMFVTAAGVTALTAGVLTAATVDEPKIRQYLEAQGYSDIRIVKTEGDHVDVTAVKNGKSEKLDVDPQTGKSKPEDDDD